MYLPSDPCFELPGGTRTQQTSIQRQHFVPIVGLRGFWLACILQEKVCAISLAPDPYRESIMKSNVTYLGAWLLAVALAFGLAVASPNDSSVMGRLPAFMAQTLLRQPVTMPEGLPSDRTLALITFQRGQHAQVESWIQGLNLRNDPSITWMRMPVVNDPGTPVGRSAVENRLLSHYPADTERAKLVPVFTDRASFVRSAGLG